MNPPRGNAWRLAWTRFRRDLSAGEIRLLLAALVLAVLAVTAVGFVTDRAQRALALEANRLLGGDAVLRSEVPIGAELQRAARAPGLTSTRTLEFPSMIQRQRGGTQPRLQLGDVRAVGAGWPLRGELRLLDAAGVERSVRGPPARGSAWLSRAGAELLDARIGDGIVVGTSVLRLDALVAQEPDAALDYFNVAPKLLLHLDDLPATGLLQEGARARHRLVVAGDAAAVERFERTARRTLEPGQRLETIGEARPELRSALDRAGRFLGLAAMLSVVLAAIAVAMAARRHSVRHLPDAAVMRCLGASQRLLSAILLGELVLIGLLAAAVGVTLAFALQWLVGDWLQRALGLSIPHAGWRPAMEGVVVGLVVLLAFAAPPILALRRVPALRVLRRELDRTEPSAWLVAASGLGAMTALLAWKAGSATLALVLLGGVTATLMVLAGFAWGLITLLHRARGRLRGSLRYGLANVSRRAGTSVAQVSALGLGLMALLLLTFVRTDLLDRWRGALSLDAPNRFVINVQPDQVAEVRAFVAARGLAPAQLVPMIRARLVSHNGRAVSAAQHAGNMRAQRLADREFNLSTAMALGADNRIVAGRWWRGRPAAPELSVEDGFAQALGWTVGDRIGFDIAGEPFQARISSLRSVEWESFRPNFFVVASPGALDGFAASYITALKVPPTRTRFTAELVGAFPNLTVIDVDAILAQVRRVGDQVATVVQAVFWFSLAAGVLVLLAAINASQDERLLEAGVMRMLGGSRRQLRAAQAVEFAAIGLLSGLVAAIAASLLSGVIAVRVFDLPWRPDWMLAAVGGGLGMLAALVAGLWATRRVLRVPPSVVLRELQA